MGSPFDAASKRRQQLQKHMQLAHRSGMLQKSDGSSGQCMYPPRHSGDQNAPALTQWMLTKAVEQQQQSSTRAAAADAAEERKLYC